LSMRTKKFWACNNRIIHTVTKLHAPPICRACALDVDGVKTSRTQSPKWGRCAHSHVWRKPQCCHAQGSYPLHVLFPGPRLLPCKKGRNRPVDDRGTDRSGVTKVPQPGSRKVQGGYSGRQVVNRCAPRPAAPRQRLP
jgi:hypothetical protein